MAKLTEQERNMRKNMHNEIIQNQMADARYYASDRFLKEDGPLNGLQMELAHTTFVDWAYVNEKADKIIRAMQDIKRAGENVRASQKALGRL